MRYLVQINENDTYTVKQKTDAKHKPRGGVHIFVEGIDTKYPIVLDTEGILSVIEDTKPVALEQAYKDMVTAIYNEMYVVFGTKNDTSAAAFAATYEAMLKRPVAYTGTFDENGVSLDTEQAVIDYATAKVTQADTYAMFRLETIANYRATKIEVENA